MPESSKVLANTIGHAMNENSDPPVQETAVPPAPEQVETPPATSAPETVALWRNPWFFLALIAIGLAGWQWVETRARLAETQQEMARRLAESDAAAKESRALANNKDNQEDKEPLFDAVDTVTDTLRIFAEMIAGVTARPENMREALRQGFATATDLADYLTRKGLPFRDAHEAVGLAVRRAEELGVDLPQLPLAELQGFSPLIDEDVFMALTVEGSLASRDHVGGTAPEQVRAAIARARERR